MANYNDFKKAASTEEKTQGACVGIQEWNLKDKDNEQVKVYVCVLISWEGWLKNSGRTLNVKNKEVFFKSRTDAEKRLKKYGFKKILMNY